MSIKIVIDGQEVIAQSGQTLIDVAADNGTYIPSLCYIKGEKCLGTCRTCSVKVNGNVAAACTVPVSEGMIVDVNDLEVADMRKALVEFLFVEGKHNCPSCEKSGRCDLQGVGYEVDMMVSRFPYRFPKRSRNVESEKVWLERDRCIFCQRCVELVHDKETNQKIFSISGRGGGSQIEIDIDLANKMSQEQVREAANLCPVGCIIEKGVGFDAPIGERKYEIETVRERALARDHK